MVEEVFSNLLDVVHELFHFWRRADELHVEVQRLALRGRSLQQQRVRTGSALAFARHSQISIGSVHDSCLSNRIMIPRAAVGGEIT